MTNSRTTAPATVQYFTYELYDAQGEPLYTGASVKPRSRISNHKSRPWGPQIDHSRTVITQHPDLDATNRAERANLAAKPWKYSTAGVTSHYTGYAPYQADHPGHTKITCAECKRVKDRTIHTAAHLEGIAPVTWRDRHGHSIHVARQSIHEHLAEHPEDADRLDDEGFIPEGTTLPESHAFSALADLMNTYTAIPRNDVSEAVSELLNHYSLAEILQELSSHANHPRKPQPQCDPAHTPQSTGN